MRDENRFRLNLEKLRCYRPDVAILLEEVEVDFLEFCETRKGELNLRTRNTTPVRYYHSQSGAMEEARQWWKSACRELEGDLERVLIIYGIELGYSFAAAKEWLQESPHHRLIFLEDDLSVLFYFLQTELATEILDHPQVLLQIFRDSGSDRMLFEEILNSCFDISSLRVYFSIVSSLYYAKTKKKTYDLLSRRLLYLIESSRQLKQSLIDQSSILIHYYENLFAIPKTTFANRLEGKFHKIPAIICGAGPSLEKQLDLIKRWENHALIIAGGTAINILNYHGINPHFCVGIDPNPSHYARVLTQTAFEVPFVFTYRMQHLAVRMIHAPRLFLTKAKMNFEEWFNQRLNLIGTALPGGLSVGNVCLQLAHLMGCDPIIFVGMDLALTKNQPYATGVINHPLVSQKRNYNIMDSLAYQDLDVEGNPIKTTFQFYKEADWFSRFASQYPDVTIINATEGGRKIPGIDDQSFTEVAEKYFHHSLDLRNLVFQEIENIHNFDITLEQVEDNVEDWMQSCKNCRKLCLESLEDLKPYAEKHQPEEALPSSLINRMALRESDLLAEEAYLYFLKKFDHSHCIILRAHENQWQRKQGKIHAGFRLVLSIPDLIKRFQSLIEHIDINLNLLAKSLHRVRDPRSVSWPVDPAKEGSGDVIVPEQDQYVFHKGKFKIVDPECGIDVEEHVAPLLIEDRLPKEEWKHKREIYQLKQNLREGQCLLLYPSGLVKAELFYQKGKLHGPSRFYSENGRLMATSWFVQGLREGKTWQYYFSGALYSIQRFKNGLRQGKQEFFYEDGTRKTVMNFIQGILQGSILLYYPNGAPKRELQFDQGKRHGKEKIWYENGQLMMEIDYDHDKPIGIARSWYEKGQPELEIVFSSPGVIESVQEWDL